MSVLIFFYKKNKLHGFKFSIIIGQTKNSLIINIGTVIIEEMELLTHIREEMAKQSRFFESHPRVKLSITLNNFINYWGNFINIGLTWRSGYPNFITTTHLF